MTRNAKQRLSPVRLKGRPAKTEMRDHWTVVLEYADEGTGPWLADLSHCTRLDIQGRPLDARMPEGIPTPEIPGGVRIQGSVAVARMGSAQAWLWRFGADPDLPPHFGRTEITEGTLGLAIMGENTFRITEKLTSLDLQPPGRTPPFLLQGPFSHVPSQIMVIGTEPGRELVILGCSRGYGHDMVHALTDAGVEFDLRSAGERRFADMLQAATTTSPSA